METTTSTACPYGKLITAFLVVIAFLSVRIDATAQATNTCGAANLWPVNSSCSYTDFNVAGSFTATYNPGTCGSGNNDDGWARFVATSTTTTITFDPDNNHRAILHVFTGGCTGSLVQVDCIDAGANGVNATVTITTVIGTTYRIRVQRRNSNDTMDGRLCVWSPPANDDPCGAISLAVGTTCTLTNYSNAGTTATAGIPAPGCSNYAGSDVWFSFVAPANGAVRIRTSAGTLTNAAMALYSATACNGTFTLIECDNTDGPGNMPFLTFSGVDLVPGDTYYLRVWGNNGNTGTFNLCINTAPATGNCFYILRLFDSWGDGWDGSTVAISVGGGAAVNYTLAAGDQDVVYIPFNNGQLIQITYTAAGPYQNEISYFLQLGSGVVFFDGPTPATGMVQSYFGTCTPPSPPASDCVGGTTVCGDQVLNANPNNTGIKADLNVDNRGCLLNDERQGYWYNFSPSASGRLEFTLSPDNSGDDYDFAIWGPTVSLQCPPSGPPFRCNYSQTTGNTGLSQSASNPSEPATGSTFSSHMDVIAGEVYTLYISNWSRSGLAFDLNWTLTNGASLDCTILPIELVAFDGAALSDAIELEWTTGSETTSSHFEVEKRQPDGTFLSIGQVAAAGQSAGTASYGFLDTAPHTGINYYRLKLVDLDGTAKASDVVPVVYRRSIGTDRPYPNPTTGVLNLDLQLANDEALTFLVFDASGREVRSFHRSLAAGTQRFEADLTALDAGTYELVVRSASGELVHAGRFIMQ